VTEQHQSLQQLSQLRDFDAFKTFYLQRDPALTDSPEFLSALIATGGFDWLEQLVEETFDEQLATPELLRPQASTDSLPLAA
jgi:hypothetical protein